MIFVKTSLKVDTPLAVSTLSIRRSAMTRLKKLLVAGVIVISYILGYNQGRKVIELNIMAYNERSVMP